MKQLSLEELSNILICPTCRQELTLDTNIPVLFCKACSVKYQVRDGKIPILVDEESRREIEDFYQNRMPYENQNHHEKRRKYRLLRQAPGISLNNRREKNLLKCLELLQEREPRILTIGTFMPPGKKVNKLELEVREKFRSALRTDIIVREGVDVVADGHKLPFDSNYFDLVVAQATMKHLKDPMRFVRQVHRILKPNGIFYCEVAYLLPYHRWPGDYVRFTPPGVRQLLKDFRIVESSYIRGPGQTFADVSAAYLALLLSFNNSPLYSALMKGFSWLFHPFKYFDIYLEKNQWSDLLGQVNYYITEKTPSHQDEI